MRPLFSASFYSQAVAIMHTGLPHATIFYFFLIFISTSYIALLWKYGNICEGDIVTKKKRNIDNNYRYRLGQNIARIRKEETGYTQEDMELYTGISRAYYGRIELGVHAATIDVLIKIADTLNIPLYRLFLDSNDRPI